MTQTLKERADAILDAAMMAEASRMRDKFGRTPLASTLALYALDVLVLAAQEAASRAKCADIAKLLAVLGEGMEYREGDGEDAMIELSSCAGELVNAAQTICDEWQDCADYNLSGGNR